MSPAVRLPDTIRRRLEAEGRLPHIPRGMGLGPAGEPCVPCERREDFAATLAAQCRQAGLPAPVREHRFHPARRWRFDLAWVAELVAVEVDGGAFIGGRHTSGAGFEEDCVKLCEAAALGWCVLRVTPRHVRSGEALGWVERALSWSG